MRIRDIFAMMGRGKQTVTEAEVQAPVPAPEVKPVASFEDKLARYAKIGRKTEISFKDDDYEYAVNPAAKAGDIEFLREVYARRPEIFENKDNLLHKDGLSYAIAAGKSAVVDFYLNEVGINPEYSAVDRYKRDESYKFPNWDALFVASVAFRPTNFMHEPGTLWQSPVGAGASAEVVFDIVLDAYKAKYADDPQGLKSAIERSYSLPDGNTFYNGSFYVQSTKRSSATTIDAACPSLKVKLQKTLHELNRTATADAGFSAPHVL